MLKAHVTIKGGIGNQLFQYAFGENIKKKWNCEVLYNVDWFDSFGSDTPRVLALFELFNFDTFKSYNLEILQSRYASSLLNRFTKFHGKEFRVEKDFNFSESYQEMPNKRVKEIFFTGYWQSGNYFMGIENDLRKKLLEYKKNFHQFYLMEKILNTTNSTSVHIRRGDYVTNKAAKITFASCSSNYYINAINKINQMTNDYGKFFIFSDDIEWVKNNITVGKNAVYIDSQYGLSDLDELFLMSICKNHIIANSSFSWWGAWIGSSKKGITICPKNWYKSSKQPDSLFPEKWICINNH